MSCGGFVVATETICQTKPNICAHRPLPGVCQRPHPHRDPHTHLPRSSLLSRWSCGLRYIQGFEIPSGILSKRIPNFQGEGENSSGDVGTTVRKVTKKEGNGPNGEKLPVSHYSHWPRHPDTMTAAPHAPLNLLMRTQWWTGATLFSSWEADECILSQLRAQWHGQFDISYGRSIFTTKASRGYKSEL